jgi:AcrR family transcriptional regulator
VSKDGSNTAIMTVELPNATALADLASLTQGRIMHGLAQMLTAGTEMTFRNLAQVSGVAERTLYRYYPNKEALLASFWIWLNDRLGMPPAPRTPQELVDGITTIFAAFASSEPLIRAMLHDPHGRATRLAHAGARRHCLRTALEPVLAPLDAAARRRLLASVQVLISAAGWETMRDYSGLRSEEAADAAQWAVAALIAAARPAPRSLSVRRARSPVRKRKKV